MRSKILTALLVACGATSMLTGCFSRDVEERPVVVQQPPAQSGTVVVTPQQQPPQVNVVPAPQ